MKALLTSFLLALLMVAPIRDLSAASVHGTAMSDVGGGAMSGSDDSNCQYRPDLSTPDNVVVNCNTTHVQPVAKAADDAVVGSGIIKRTVTGKSVMGFGPLRDAPNNSSHLFSFAYRTGVNMRMIVVGPDRIDGFDVSWYPTKQECLDDIPNQRKLLGSVAPGHVVFTCTKLPN